MVGWRVVASGARVPALSEVAVVSPTDVWAVGGGTLGSGASFRHTPPVIVHWNGKRLRTQRAFTPSLAAGQMTAVAAVTADDIWAVGNDYNASYTVGRPVALHWDGEQWQRMQLPIASGWLYDVAAIAADDVWAVGKAASRPLVLHWNGRAWSVVPTPPLGRTSALNAVDGTSAHSVWAAGAEGLDGPTYGISNLMLRWNGQRWTRLATGSNSASEALDATSSDEAWVYEFDWGESGGDDWLVRWSRGMRKLVSSYSGSGNLEDIAAVSATSIWAVGARAWEPDYPLVTHWNGKAMRVQPAFANMRGTSLEAIVARSPTDVWAVGDHLIARYSR